MDTKLDTIPVDQILVESSVLPRDAHEQTIEEYSIWGRTHDYPPIVVFQFPGSEQYVLADGLQRLEAAKKRKEPEVDARIYTGDVGDAIWYAAGANREHGLPLTNKEKRRAVLNVLKHQALRSRTNTSIAEQVGVSAGFVGKLVASMGKPVASMGNTDTTEAGEEEEPRVVTTSAGRDIQTNNIGRATTATSAKVQGRPKKSRAKALKDIEAGTFETPSGEPVPELVRQVFLEANDLDDFCTNVGKLVEDAQKLTAIPSGAGKQIDLQRIADAAQEIRTAVSVARPHAPCPDCRVREKVAQSCACDGKGWFTRPEYARLVLAQAGEEGGNDEGDGGSYLE